MRVLINSKLNSKYGNLLLFVYIIIIITVRYSTKKERKKKNRTQSPYNPAATYSTYSTRINILEPYVRCKNN